MKLPRLRPTTHMYRPDGDSGVVLLSGTRSLILSHPLYGKLLPLLDGTRPVAALAAALKPVGVKEVLGALHTLQKEGFLVDAAHAPSAPPAPQGESRDHHPPVPPSSTAEVHAIGNVSAAPFVDALAAAGFATGDADPVLDIVITEDYLSPGVESFASRARRPWLLVCPGGQELWIGPLFTPGQNACWECLAHRLRANRAIHLYVAHAGDPPPAPAADRTPATDALAARWTARLAAQWAAGQRPHPLQDTLWTWDPATLTEERHTVWRRPQCPRCGSVAGREPKLPVLRDGIRAVAADGGYRSASAVEALQRLRRHLSPITGVINRLNPVPDSEGLHVYTAKVYPTRPLRTWKDVVEAERFYAGGKGTTEDQAKVSALAEALERHSSRLQGDEPTRVASYAELGDRAIHPDRLTLFSERQLRSRAPESDDRRFNRIPPPLDPAARIPWTPVWSFTRSDWRMVPTSYLYMGASGEYPVFCYSDSNGNAAGSSFEDAVLQGFLELIERDAAALWWYNRIPRPEVLLRNVDDEFIARLTDAYARMGRRFWLLDITSDFGIPTFIALTRQEEGPEQLCSGMGSHFDPRIAALRALTEMNQLLPHVLPFAQREDRQVSPRRGPKHDLHNARLAEHPYLAPDPAQPPRRMEDYPRLNFPDLASAVRHGIALSEARGLEFLAHDLTRPDIDLPVAKVIVPGLRLHWRRTAPGRLYDVPVQLGWLPRPYTEDELNPLDLSS